MSSAKQSKNTRRAGKGAEKKESGETSGGRQRILFTNAEYGMEDGDYVFIAGRMLRERYDLDLHPELREGIAGLVEKSLLTIPYSLLITHVPRDRNAARLPVYATADMEYFKSLDIIKRIKRLADIPIIAYTGASPAGTAHFPCCGIDKIIHRAGKVAAEAEQIVAAADQLLRTYQEGLPSAPEPDIVKQGGHTRTEVTVTLLTGLDAFAAAQIAMQCNQYPQEVICRNMASGCACSLKEIMGALTLEASKGVRLSIDIEGETPEADQLAREICSALSSKYSSLLDFHRFVR